jgi:hypothetical protein
MEDKSVEEADLGQGDEVFHMAWRDIWEEFEADRPLAGRHLDRVDLLGDVDILLGFLAVGFAIGFVHGARFLA